MLAPHYLAPQAPARPDSFGDYTIKPGEVTDVIYPEDPRSIGKKLVEYAVEVQFLDPQTGTGRARTYRATLANHLAGSSEREVLVLRADKPDPKTGIGRGSKVVVACLNGEQNAAVILGGLRDTTADDDLGLKDQKVVYRRDLNGVVLTVKLDGSASWSLTGPKDLDGETTKEPDRIGSLRMEVDGSTSIGTSTGAEDAQDDYVRVDAADRKIKVRAQAGLHVGQASEPFPLFSTYRRAQADLHSRLQIQMTQCQIALTTCSSLLTSAAVSMLIPIVGAILAAPSVSQVGAQLALASQAFLQMSTAIQSFEAQSSRYLSSLNKND